ncbi:hypothetical protein CHS0354_016946 [Potamilus streckersoni]|uniref:Uncharacterized protein n=1 Tax=Potamilus streckersoni TaxID=2493646 RepID=A0AAE0VR06_9BIVA|nr:hypothetical protein CHS0354_016946 [Potamilus streckersoni]
MQQEAFMMLHRDFIGMSLPLGLETVWLEDITKLQNDKRTLADPGLPAQLTFSLRRKSDALKLQLKKNYDIDPNADIYVVQRTNNGRTIVTKTQSLEKEVNFQSSVCKCILLLFAPIGYGPY